MRVLIFSTAYIPYIGGAEIAVKEITDRLPEMEFVMITARLDKKNQAHERVGQLDVHRIGKGSSWDKFRLFFQGVKKARALGKFDLVWSIMASYAGLAALRYRNKTRTKFLLTLQEGDSRRHIYKHVWFIWFYFKRIFKQADRIQAISAHLADWAKKLGAVCPVEVVPNGVDSEKFKMQNSKCQISLRYELGLSEKDRIVITASRLVKKNGVGNLVEAIALLPNNVNLLVLGLGELAVSLRMLAKERGIEKRVHFLGAIAPDDVPPHLEASDVFCRPSLSEGLGSAFLEAMAAGVPVIGTKVGGIPDFLREGETGWFCEVENPASIAEKIKYVLDENNKAEVKKVVENASRMIRDNYLWDNIARQMRQMFDNTVRA